MSKQCLDVHQMQHLQELGLELKDTMMYWTRCVHTGNHAEELNKRYGGWFLTKGNNAQTVGLMHWEFIPAYTLQDVLDILPAEINPAERRFWLRIDLSDECLYYYYDDCNLVERRKKVIGYDGIEELIDAAYSMLCWTIENGYVETNKNE